MFKNKMEGLWDRRYNFAAPSLQMRWVKLLEFFGFIFLELCSAFLGTSGLFGDKSATTEM